MLDGQGNCRYRITYPLPETLPLVSLIICTRDRVDLLHESNFRIMLTHMLDANISACLQVILMGRNIERIADLATNIAEDVVFMVEGITVRHGGRARGEEEAGATATSDEE